jgi:hypothetical protein
MGTAAPAKSPVTAEAKSTFFHIDETSFYEAKFTWPNWRHRSKVGAFLLTTRQVVLALRASPTEVREITGRKRKPR